MFIHDIRFKGRQAIEWEDVEMYLKQYVGEARIIKSTNAKAKANAAQGIPEMIRFALPVFDEEGEIKYYNVFKVIMVVRHAEDGKLYLYDIMNIKKETGTHFQS